MADLEKRIESEAQGARRITNAELKCRDCTYALDDSVKFGNTSRCDKYILKPNRVLLGGDCPRYRKKKGKS